MEVQSSKYLQFEKPIHELQDKIEELRTNGFSESSSEIGRLREKLEDLELELYESLSPWQKVQLARHPLRPRMGDYLGMIFDYFQELHGDRYFGDDHAIVGGLSAINGSRVMVIGHEKGRTTREKLHRNFGMARPEGFRKALRLMKMAEKFKLPLISFVDTPGAYPGVGAEERGQPRAIADNLKQVFGIRTPIIIVIIGEGGSGGALAIAVGDRVLMMEHAVYSVISPEGCATILWRDKGKAAEAASSLRLTADDCLAYGVVDRIIKENHGAAHRDPEGNADHLKNVLIEEIATVGETTIDALIEKRRNKFYSMGIFKDRS